MRKSSRRIAHEHDCRGADQHHLDDHNRPCEEEEPHEAQEGFRDSPQARNYDQRPDDVDHAGAHHPDSDHDRCASDDPCAAGHDHAGSAHRTATEAEEA